MSRNLCFALSAFVLSWPAPGPVRADVISLRVCAWNVESGDADPDHIARRIETEDGIDIWGLSEVSGDDDARLFEEAAGRDEGATFRRIVGTTGGADRLVVLYNSARLRPVRVEELHAMNIGGNVRAPLVVEFEGVTTGRRFLFVVNHLYRGRADRRHQQPEMLNDWAEQQTLPIINLGDFNYDWHFQTGDVDHDAGYDLLTDDSVFAWVRPEILVPTNASGHRSVLDFVFVAGDATGWQFESKILAIAGDFPDDATKSDHRPVDATFTFDTTVVEPPVPPMPSDEEILRRIAELEAELRRLREIVEGRRGGDED